MPAWCTRKHLSSTSRSSREPEKDDDKLRSGAWKAAVWIGEQSPREVNSSTSVRFDYIFDAFTYSVA